MFIVYIIESATTAKWYYGFTERLAERVNEHNSSNGHFTDGKGPWKLIFQRTFTEKKDALQFEKELKKLRNKGYIQTKYSEFFIKI